MNPKKIQCNVCSLYRPLILFRIIQKKYRSTVCKPCGNKLSVPKKKQQFDISQTKPSKKQKKNRVNPNMIPVYILNSARRYDAKNGLRNDLTLEFIKQKISEGCEYCGETKLRMTLDRINNGVGHLQINVNAACVRCNVVRRDMPYNVWLKVIPALRVARKQGLFGEWKGIGKPK